jgi:hypothetical protein
VKGERHVANYSGVRHVVWHGGHHGSTRKGFPSRKKEGRLKILENDIQHDRLPNTPEIEG